MVASKAKAGLLKLPAELRNHIYELVLTPEGGVPVETQAREEWHDYGRYAPPDAVTKRAGWFARPTSTPALLSVNSQIRTEALPIYYKVNTFMASFGARLDKGFLRSAASWLKIIGPERASQIEKFIVRFVEQDLRKAACTTDFIKAGHNSMCTYGMDTRDLYWQCIFPHSEPRKYQIIEAMGLVEHGLALDKIRVLCHQMRWDLGTRGQWQETWLED